MSPLFICLHHSAESKTGWNAWCLDAPGFAIWADISATVLARVPSTFAEYQLWLRSHGLPQVAVDSHIDLVETVRGDEMLFARDARPATLELTDQTIAPLHATRLHL